MTFPVSDMLSVAPNVILGTHSYKMNDRYQTNDADAQEPGTANLGPHHDAMTALYIVYSRLSFNLRQQFSPRPVDYPNGKWSIT